MKKTKAAQAKDEEREPTERTNPGATNIRIKRHVYRADTYKRPTLPPLQKFTLAPALCVVFPDDQRPTYLQSTFDRVPINTELDVRPFKEET